MKRASIKDEKRAIITLSSDDWKFLRKYSIEHDQSVNYLINELVKKFRENVKKRIDRAA